MRFKIEEVKQLLDGFETERLSDAVSSLNKSNSDLPYMSLRRAERFLELDPEEYKQSLEQVTEPEKEALKGILDPEEYERSLEQLTGPQKEVLEEILDPELNDLLSDVRVGDIPFLVERINNSESYWDAVEEVEEDAGLKYDVGIRISRDGPVYTVSTSLSRPLDGVFDREVREVTQTINNEDESASSSSEGSSYGIEGLKGNVPQRLLDVFEALRRRLESSSYKRESLEGNVPQRLLNVLEELPDEMVIPEHKGDDPVEQIKEQEEYDLSPKQVKVLGSQDVSVWGATVETLQSVLCSSLEDPHYQRVQDSVEGHPHALITYNQFAQGQKIQDESTLWEEYIESGSREGPRNTRERIRFRWDFPYERGSDGINIAYKLSRKN